MGDLDQPAEFLDGQRPAIVAAILLGVVSGQADQGILGRPAVLPSPAGEGPAGGPVMVEALERQAGGAEGGQGGLRPVPGQVGQPGGREAGRRAAGAIRSRSARPVRRGGAASARGAPATSAATRRTRSRLSPACLEVWPAAIRWARHSAR